jgi:hypothetical protein
LLDLVVDLVQFAHAHFYLLLGLLDSGALLLFQFVLFATLHLFCAECPGTYFSLGGESAVIIEAAVGVNQLTAAGDIHFLSAVWCLFWWGGLGGWGGVGWGWGFHGRLGFTISEVFVDFGLQ